MQLFWDCTTDMGRIFMHLWDCPVVKEKTWVHVLFKTKIKPGGKILMYFLTHISYSVQFSLVTQSCPTLCDPMKSSTPGLPVHHQLPEFAQTHVHRVSDAIQPSHPLSSPSPVPNLSQRQGLLSQLFTWGGQSIGVSASASVLPTSTQDWSPSEWTGWIS